MTFDFFSCPKRHFFKAVYKAEESNVTYYCGFFSVWQFPELEFPGYKVFADDFSFSNVAHIDGFELPSAHSKLNISLIPDLKLSICFSGFVVFVWNDIGEPKIRIQWQVESCCFDSCIHYA